MWVSDFSSIGKLLNKARSTSRCDMQLTAIRILRLCSTSTIAVLLVAATVWAGNPDALTDDERLAGFELLFTGQDLDGWMPTWGTLEDCAWTVDDGAIHFPEGGWSSSLAYQRKAIPADFDLRFEWKEAATSKSGLQGHFLMGIHGSEMQNKGSKSPFCGYSAYSVGGVGGVVKLVVEDVEAPTGVTATCLYETPTRDTKRAAGQWNDARMVCKGPIVQHWLNGEKILEVDFHRKSQRESGNGPWSQVRNEWLKARTRESRLTLSPGDGSVWYRRLRVRAIPEKEEITLGNDGPSQRKGKGGKGNGDITDIRALGPD